MISVCLATYNGKDVVLEQLQSILPQLSAGDEVIVSDDGSTDGTVESVRSLGSPLIRLIEGPRKHSSTANFEHALRAAKGDIIFLSDQDDRWEPEKVSVMLAALEQADCVVSDCYVTDGSLHTTAASFYALNHTRPGRAYNLWVKNGYLGCCMAFRRNVLERSLPFPRHIPMHDIWIGNVAAYCYRVAFIPNRLIRFRRHGHNASSTAAPSTNPLWRKLLLRWQIALPLIGRRCRRG